MNTYGVCVCRAALLSLDNKAGVHYHIYRFGVKEIAAPSDTGRGEKGATIANPISSQGNETGRGLQFVTTKTQPGTGRGVGGKVI